MGDGFPDVLHSRTSSTSSSSVVQLGTLPKFLDDWRSISSNKFVLNMTKGHHLQLRCNCPFICIIKWFNIKAAMAHHPTIQKEMNKLLPIGVIEPSAGDTQFYSNVFFIPKYTGGLQPILNLKWFNCCMHIPTFKMPTIKPVWHLIQQCDYAFSIDVSDTCIHCSYCCTSPLFSSLAMAELITVTPVCVC